MKTALRKSFADADRMVITQFLQEAFPNVRWSMDWLTDTFAKIDLQLTGMTLNRMQTYDVEVKAVSATREYDVCFFDMSKWYGLIGYDNNTKLYVVIYPFLNKIAVWNVTGDLLRHSEKELKELPITSTDGEQIEKTLYRFKLSDAKVYDYALTEEQKQTYDALFTKSKQYQKATYQDTNTTDAE